MDSAIIRSYLTNSVPGAERSEAVLYLMLNGVYRPSVRFQPEGKVEINTSSGWQELGTATVPKAIVAD